MSSLNGQVDRLNLNTTSPKAKKASKSYVLEFNGEVSEGFFPSDQDAESWAESVLERRGYSVEDIVSSEWGAYGPNEERMLFWESEEVAENDPGAKAICSIQRAK